MIREFDLDFPRKLPKTLVAKQAKHVKALFEYLPAFPLSHACIVTDALTLPSPKGRGEVVPTKTRHELGEGVNDKATKQAELVKALFECLPAFLLSRA